MPISYVIDPAEQNDLSAFYPEIIGEMETIFKEAMTAANFFFEEIDRYQ